MNRLTIDNYDSFVNLYKQLSYEDPYVLMIDKEEFLKNNNEMIASGNIDIFILNKDGQDIGFLEVNKEDEILFIENIFLIKEYRFIDNYKSILLFADNLGEIYKSKILKFIGVNDVKNLMHALEICGYIMEKEHIQMEKYISDEKYSAFDEYRLFKDINDDDLIYGFMKDCMKGNIFNYSMAEVKNIIEDKEYFSYIFLKDKQPLGFGISNISAKRNEQENSKILYIEQIAVLGDFRRMGAGGDIIRFLNKIGENMKMEKSRLHVYRDNTNALSLYKRLGYSEIKSIGFWQKYLC